VAIHHVPKGTCLLATFMNKKMTNNNISEVNDDNFQREVIDSSIPVLLDFGADWCAPCKMIAPFMEELAAEYKKKIKICEVNVDTNKEISEKYQITAIPTLLFFKDGNIMSKQIGLCSKKELKEKIEKILVE